MKIFKKLAELKAFDISEEQIENFFIDLQNGADLETASVYLKEVEEEKEEQKKEKK